MSVVYFSCVNFYRFYTAPTSCPVLSPALSFVTVNGRLYHVGKEKLAWKYAKEYCNQLNLELASVATQDDYNNVMSIHGE